MSRIQSTQPINNRMKLIVFGYIRQQESSSSINIPKMLSFLCLSYYLVDEYFKKALKKYVDISNDNMMITNIGGQIPNEYYSLDLGTKNWCSNYTIYCNQWIPTMATIMVQWTFFIKQMSDVISFNLVSSDESVDKEYRHIINQSPCYQIQNNGYSHEYYISSTSGLKIDKYMSWKSNDTITFILDFSDVSISGWYIQINGQPKRMISQNLYKGEDIRYKMVIQMPYINDCVILKKFQETYYTPTFPRYTDDM